MKKTLLSLVAVACLAVASQLISCNSHTYQAVTNLFEPGSHLVYDSNRYRLNEIIVIYRKPPNTSDVQKIKEWMLRNNAIDTTKIERKKCNSCKGSIELWLAPDVHSTINADGIVGGTVSPKGSRPVGEDGIAYYSLNFTQDIPMDYTEKKFEDMDLDTLKKLKNDKREKEVVRIAVLDTGIDTEQINASYLWTNEAEASRGAKPDFDDDVNCYNDDIFGWNFIGKNGDVMDDNTKRHGTLVSLFIINEFANSQSKAVELMTLKTHDKDGHGDLFYSICAIHYAMEKGADIINASWGFYYYGGSPHPYLDSLITKVLRKEGILFVAAAGNQDAKSDKFAHEAYKAEHGVDIPDSYLRDLEYHSFYPACLSGNDNNVITVTTADKTNVSPTQNYSEKYVDQGAIPDDPTMRFQVPFDPGASVKGSSFAAPIVTGRIGSSLPNSAYVTNIDKRDVLSLIEGSSLSSRSSSLEHEKVRLGRLTKHN